VWFVGSKGAQEGIEMSENREGLTTENRLLAALAHGAIITQGLGLLAGVIVYVNQREKSRWAAFQALQAAVYQVITLLITIGLWIVWGVFYAISFIPLIQLPEGYEGAPPPIFVIALVSMVIPMLYMLVVGLYGLWGALQTWQGKDFRYAVIGGWLERSGLWKNGNT
jgi:uncharacterized Tic20 family protein